MLMQGLMMSGRKAHIEITDIGAQPPAGHLTYRMRMMLEGDDTSMFEMMSPSLMVNEKQRFEDCLTHLSENGVLVASLQVIDNNRGFEAVMKRSAMKKMGMV